MGCVGGGVVSRVVGVATTKKKKKKRRDAQQNSHIHFTCYSFSVFFLVERVRSVQVIILMAGTRCVPWHSWAEWEFVADAFLRRRRRRLPEKDDDEKKKTEKKRRALELVQMWRTRGRVPVAVDAHAQIVELQLMDEELMMKKKKKMMMMKKNNPRDDGDGEDKKKETTTSNHQQSESTVTIDSTVTESERRRDRMVRSEVLGTAKTKIRTRRGRDAVGDSSDGRVRKTKKKEQGRRRRR